MSIARESGPLKWNLNTVLALAGFGLTLLLNIVGGTVLWTNQARDIADVKGQVLDISKRLDTEAADRKDRIRDFSKIQTDMQTQIAGIVPLSYQVTQSITTGSTNAEAIKQTNVRIDRVVESVGAKLDTVVDALNKLSVTVSVINSKIEDNRPTTQKSVWNQPTIIPH